jgi:hypothetical protein
VSLVGGIGEMAGLLTRQQRERNVLLNPRRMDAVFEAWAGEAADSGISAYRRGVAWRWAWGWRPRDWAWASRRCFSRAGWARRGSCTAA